MVWWVASSRASKSRRNSLTVNAISPAGVGVGVAFDRGGHGQEGMGEHGQGGPAMPGSPAPDLVLIESGQAFGGLEGFLDAPALAGDGDQGAQRHRARAVAAQVGVLAGGVVAADQQMVNAGVGVVFGQQPKPGPRVQPRAVCPGTSGVPLPGARREAARAARRRGSGRRGWAPAGWPRRPAHTPGRDREPRPADRGSAP